MKVTVVLGYAKSHLAAWILLSYQGARPSGRPRLLGRAVEAIGRSSAPRAEIHAERLKVVSKTYRLLTSHVPQEKSRKGIQIIVELVGSDLSVMPRLPFWWLQCCTVARQGQVAYNSCEPYAES